MERLLGVAANSQSSSARCCRDWFNSSGGSRTSESGVFRDVVLYPDVYTNYVQVDRGKASVQPIEALDIHVWILEGPAISRSPLSQGMISTTENEARGVYKQLSMHFGAGRDVVVIGPRSRDVRTRVPQVSCPKSRTKGSGTAVTKSWSTCMAFYTTEEIHCYSGLVAMPSPLVSHTTVSVNSALWDWLSTRRRRPRRAGIQCLNLGHGVLRDGRLLRI